VSFHCSIVLPRPRSWCPWADLGDVQAGSLMANETARGSATRCWKSASMSSASCADQSGRRPALRAGFSLDLIADLAVRSGSTTRSGPESGPESMVWTSGRTIVWQLGPWVPGERTTLEFLPVCGSSEPTTTMAEDSENRPDAPAGCAPDARLHRAPLGGSGRVWYKGGKSSVEGAVGEARS